MSDVHVYRHKHLRLGGSGDMLPQEIFLKLDVLRLLLRPFWDRSRAVVAIVDQFQTVWDLNVQLSGVYKIFWRTKGGFE